MLKREGINQKKSKLRIATLASVVTLFGAVGSAQALTYSEYVDWHTQNALSGQAAILANCSAQWQGGNTMTLTDADYNLSQVVGHAWQVCTGGSETHSPSYVIANSNSGDDQVGINTMTTAVTKTTQTIAARVASVIRPSSSRRAQTAALKSDSEGIKNVLSSLTKSNDSGVGLSYDKTSVGVNAGDSMNGFSLTAGRDFGQMGLSAGATADNGLGIWINASYINTEDKHFVSQSDGDMFMVIAGIDKRVTDDAAIGIAFTYEDNEEDTNIRSAGAGMAESSAFTVAPYGVAMLTDSVTLDASAGFSWVDSDKRSAAGVTSSFDSTRLFMALNLNGYASAGKFDLSSSFGWLSAWEEVEAYVDSAAQASSEKTNELSQVSVKGEVSYPTETVEPYINMRLEKDLTWTDVVGIVHDEYGATLGGGIRFWAGNMIGELNGEVDVGREQFEQYSIMGNLRYEF